MEERVGVRDGDVNIEKRDVNIEKKREVRKWMRGRREEDR